MESITISKILAGYKTDKVNGHCYGDFYDDLFSKYDRDDRINILEIGTQKGGSLCAWRDYFPNAKITGIDIIDVVKEEYKRDSINYIFMDVKDFKSDEVFDIIIDDGSHFLKDVLYVVDNLKYKVLVIEDVQSQEWLNHISGQVVDLRHINNNYDDFLIICKS